MQSSRFEITANISAGATQEQLRLMEQNLLAERFKLAVHFVKKEMQTYEMTVGKDAPKFKEWDETLARDGGGSAAIRSTQERSGPTASVPRGRGGIPG